MNKASKTVLVAMAAGLAACSENSMAPRVEAPESSTSYVDGGGATMHLSAVDTIRFSITIDPSRNTYYNLGDGNSLTFPAGSLCDVNKSSYGEKEWDQPCTKATAKLIVNVKAWMDRYGHARVDFDKHVRFVPTNIQSQMVVITFADLEAALDPYFNIEYCPGGNSGCKDESKKDASLVTRRDPSTGKITRRIKHFSGYNVAAGRSGDGGDYNLGANTASSLTKVAALPGFMSPTAAEMLFNKVRFVRRASGYILASG